MVVPKFLKPNNFKTTFQKNLTCVILSLRADSKKSVCHDWPCSQGSRLSEYVQQINQTSSFGASHISSTTATHQFVPHPDPGRWGPRKWHWFILEFQSLFYKSTWYVRIKFFVWNQHTIWKTKIVFFWTILFRVSLISRW